MSSVKIKNVKRILIVLQVFSLNYFGSAYAKDDPVCEYESTDTDGDGWGWESGASCRSKPSILDPVTGELVPLQRAEWQLSDLIGTTLSCGAQVAYECGDRKPSAWNTSWCSGDTVLGSAVYKFLLDGSVQVERFHSGGVSTQLTFDEAITERFADFPVGFIEHPVASRGYFTREPQQNEFAIHLDPPYLEEGDENTDYPVTRSRLLCTAALPNKLVLACVDDDGDGWGWNGVDSCAVTGRYRMMGENTPLPEASKLHWSTSDLAGKEIQCDERSYDGLAGVYVGRPILYEIHENGEARETTVVVRPNASDFFFRDDFAWQLNIDGSFVSGQSTEFNLPAYPIVNGYVFIDSTFSADNEGLLRVNKYSICTTNDQPLRATGSRDTYSNCVDTDGDGWGWDGNQSCIIGER